MILTNLISLNIYSLAKKNAKIYYQIKIHKTVNECHVSPIYDYQHETSFYRHLTYTLHKKKRMKLFW